MRSNERLNRRTCLRRLGLSAAALGLASLDGWGRLASAQGASTNLKIGVLLNQSGESEIRDGIQLAADVINERGGINGNMRLELLIEDGRFSSVEAVNAANRFVNRGDIGFVLGPLLSVQALATQPIFAAAGMAQIYFGSVEAFTQQHAKAPLSLRYGVQTSIEMAPVAKYAVEVAQQKKFFVLAQNSDTGRSYVASLRAALEKAGGGFVAEPEFYPSMNRDFATLMAKVKNSGANALLTGTGLPVEIIAAVDEYEHQGLTPDKIGFYGNITLTNQSFFSQVGIKGRADGFIFPWIFDDGTDPRDFARTQPSEQAIAMTQAFIQRFGHPPVAEGQLTAWGWGAVQLIKQAIEGLIAERGADFVGGLNQTTGLSRAVVEYVLAGATPDTPGRTFKLTFGDLGFLSCGQAAMLAGVGTYKNGTRWLVQDRPWAQALMPPLC